MRYLFPLFFEKRQELCHSLIEEEENYKLDYTPRPSKTMQAKNIDRSSLNKKQKNTIACSTTRTPCRATQKAETGCLPGLSNQCTKT
jgi:hypothetical protein